jgi:hypothetical protein
VISRALVILVKEGYVDRQEINKSSLHSSKKRFVTGTGSRSPGLIPGEPVEPSECTPLGTGQEPPGTNGNHPAPPAETSGTGQEPPGGSDRFPRSGTDGGTARRLPGDNTRPVRDAGRTAETG